MSCDEPAVFLTSIITKMLNIHPQTLRLYEREGFIHPTRTQGNLRLYSQQDVEQLRLVLHLTRDLGVNLAGITVILRMRESLEKLQQEIASLQHEIRTSLGPEASVVVRPYALIRATSRMLVKVT